MSDADWIVLRFDRSIPADEIPQELEGKWIDRSLVGETFAATRRVASLPPNTSSRTWNTVAWPTGRFEMNDDLNVAEVYEVENWATAS